MISIIIPVINEVENIGKLLSYLFATASEKNISEIIVVDGGSFDGTQDTILKISETAPFKTVLISSEKGRAKQMNLGAQNASGSILYFLHADSFPPKEFDTSILMEINKGNHAGCFRMKFDSKHLVLVFSQWFTKFNFKVCRGGDQSLFVSKNLFQKLSGFNEQYAIYGRL
jgi:Glycosyltransferases involved in cell wall biogenesis